MIEGKKKISQNSQDSKMNKETTIQSEKSEGH